MEDEAGIIRGMGRDRPGMIPVYPDPSPAGTMTVTKEGYPPHQGSVAVRV
ncbi:MAG TPA: hypothetical protein PLF04_10405 [Candidatus Fermentibacter daniensis]|nr:hypothetical protein [Candidatus Fermentibacter daniensis]